MDLWIVNFLALTETKLDDLFPTSEFLVDGFSRPFGLDRNIPRTIFP